MDMKEILKESQAYGFRKMAAKRRKRGFSLLELAMVMGIGVLIAVGVMMFFTQANTSKNTQEALTQVAAIQQAARSLYGGQPVYTGLVNKVLIDTKALPIKMVNGTTGLRNAFSGAVVVAAADSGGGTASGFSVSFAGIPQDACVKMAASDLGRGLYSVQVGGTTRTAGSSAPPPFDPASAATACSAATNTIIWIFS
jgi:prepilin-type N-terminal cleavage/methylation domain-containing protein